MLPQSAHGEQTVLISHLIWLQANFSSPSTLDDKSEVARGKLGCAKEGQQLPTALQRGDHVVTDVIIVVPRTSS